MSIIDLEFLDKCYNEFVNWGGMKKFNEFVIEPTQLYITNKILDPTIDKLTDNIKNYIIILIVFQTLILIFNIVILFIMIMNTKITF